VTTSEEQVIASMALLEEIVSRSNEVNGLVSDITLASNEQAQGLSEIRKSMHQLDDVSRQNSDAGSNIAESAQHLSAQADTLDRIVTSLKVIVEGKNSPKSA
jgi:methyl-accepting chemotaxis protein